MPIIYKKNYDRDYDILHTIVPILRHVNLKSLLLRFSVYFMSYEEKSTEFEFEFGLRIPVGIPWIQPSIDSAFKSLQLTRFIAIIGLRC